MVKRRPVTGRREQEVLIATGPVRVRNLHQQPPRFGPGAFGPCLHHGLMRRTGFEQGDSIRNIGVTVDRQDRVERLGIGGGDGVHLADDGGDSRSDRAGPC